MLNKQFIIAADENSGEVVASRAYPKTYGMTVRSSFDLVRTAFPKAKIYSPLDRAPAGTRFIVVYLSSDKSGQGRSGRNWDRYGVVERIRGKE